MLQGATLVRDPLDIEKRKRSSLLKFLKVPTDYEQLKRACIFFDRCRNQVESYR